MNEGVRVDAAVNGLRLTGIEFDARTLRVIAEAAAIRPNSLSTASNLISGNAPRPRGSSHWLVLIDSRANWLSYFSKATGLTS